VWEEGEGRGDRLKWWGRPRGGGVWTCDMMGCKEQTLNDKMRAPLAERPTPVDSVSLLQSRVLCLRGHDMVLTLEWLLSQAV
jgi:hypothetical protein